ncbi:MAG: hypothetical protein IBJ18_01790 [Phycisphaerales bacterium]|nr:hypothetical protein [Phycisphaerales bacterium]
MNITDRSNPQAAGGLSADRQFLHVERSTLVFQGASKRSEKRIPQIDVCASPDCVEIWRLRDSIILSIASIFGENDRKMVLFIRDFPRKPPELQKKRGDLR